MSATVGVLAGTPVGATEGERVSAAAGAAVGGVGGGGVCGGGGSVAGASNAFTKHRHLAAALTPVINLVCKLHVFPFLL